jgi:hypothetical protein
VSATRDEDSAVDPAEVHELRREVAELRRRLGELGEEGQAIPFLDYTEEQRLAEVNQQTDRVAEQRLSTQRSNELA